MNCPRCNKRTTVADSRCGNDTVIRVRKCKCGVVFRTTEYIDNSEETAEEWRDLKQQAYNKCLAKKAKEILK